jgi:CYTH domain-containing protein
MPPRENIVTEALRIVLSDASISVEDAPADGKEKIEDELVAFAELSDPSILKQAQSSCKQEQWQFRIVRNDSCLIFRVRKALWDTAESPTQYILTIKSPLDASGKRSETELEVTNDIFELFKSVAERGMIKTRYCFDVIGRPGKLEVDVFEDTKMVKIDYELSPGEDRTFPELPAEFTNVIYQSTSDSNERATIEAFYKSTTIYTEKKE